MTEMQQELYWKSDKFQQNPDHTCCDLFFLITV